MYKKGSLLEHEARELLRSYSIKVLDYELCTTVDATVKAASNMGFPVALKVVSPQIVHKSDIGGVKLNLKTESEVRKAYKDIMESVNVKMPQAEVSGILVSPYIEGGTEIIVGALNDFQFGPVVMVGLGGVFTEIFKDVSFNIAPVSYKEALSMMESLKAYPIMQGYRGKKGINVKDLGEMIVKVSELVSKESIEELDLNPVLCFKDEVVVVDARILMSKENKN